MHAFLIIGNTAGTEVEINNLSKKLAAKIIFFPILKIEDTRDLSAIIRLSFESPVLIVSENIDLSTPEALNAFLKNLEEPQENVYFALTAPSLKKVLPTIASRCQIIFTNILNQVVKDTTEAEEFLKMTVSERLSFIDKIKDRPKAIDFTENLATFVHKQIHLEESNKNQLAKAASASLDAYKNIKGNGNIALQLTNLVVNLD